MAVPVPRELDVTVIPVGGPVYVLVTDRTHERAVEKMRADFVANSSHELRTPLASLIGFIETLRGPAADDPRRSSGSSHHGRAGGAYAAPDRRSAQPVAHRDFRAPAAGRSGSISAPLLDGFVAGMEPMSRKAPAAGGRTCRPTCRWCRLMPTSWRRCFTNLLDNAIKYGKRGRLHSTVGGAGAGRMRAAANGVLLTRGR